MKATRRMMSPLVGMAPFYSIAGTAIARELASPADNLVLSNFDAEEEFIIPGAEWRGFSDRVMGGVSNAEFCKD